MPADLSGGLYTLIVKGSRAQAVAAASRRFHDIATEIRATAASGSDTTLAARLPREAEAKLHRWFAEDAGKKPPYAAGSLLWFGTRSGNGLGFDPTGHRSRGRGGVAIALDAALLAKLELSRGNCRHALRELVEAAEIAGGAKAHSVSARDERIGHDASRVRRIIGKLHDRALDRCVK